MLAGLFELDNRFLTVFSCWMEMALTYEEHRCWVVGFFGSLTYFVSAGTSQDLLTDSILRIVASHKSSHSPSGPLLRAT